uniref:Translation initiation factor eIF2B subunit alpha n=1 Tax=Elaeophora elaphi TaxID=1147741 RepID=A0A0R3RJQ8_9BILA
MELHIAEHFQRLLDGEYNLKSTGQAAIETLMRCIEISKAKTVNELTDELRNAVAAMSTTDHSIPSIRSASELFLRFISLATPEENVQEFSILMHKYKERGNIFLERVEMSKTLIAYFAGPFIRNNMRILTHSYSKVVLEVLLNAGRRGVNAHVFVTESCPDKSGKIMIKALEDAGIQCTLILDAGVGYIMETIDLVMVGAEGVMETGGIINKIGTHPLAVCAKAMHKPFFVMAESIKFVKEYPLSQNDIPIEFKYTASTLKKHEIDGDFSNEYPLVDYTPPQYINLLFTNLGILTPAAVGDELIKLYV